MRHSSFVVVSVLMLALGGCPSMPESENPLEQMKIVQAVEARVQKAFGTADTGWQARFNALQAAVNADKGALIGVADSCASPGDNARLNTSCAASRAKALQLLTYLPAAEMGANAPDGKVSAIASATSAFCATQTKNVDCEMINVATATSGSGRAATEMMAMAFGPPGSKKASDVKDMISNFETSVSRDWPAFASVSGTDAAAQKTLADRKRVLLQQTCSVNRATDWVIADASKRIADEDEANAISTARDRAIRTAVLVIKPEPCRTDGATCTERDWLDAFTHPTFCPPL